MNSDSPILLRTKRFFVQQVQQVNASGEQHERAIVRHPGSVVILPIIDENHICLIRNYRVSVDDTLIELPAGTREPDEEPEKTAHRELIEETGYRAESMMPLHSFYAAPGILDEYMHLFVATGLTEGKPDREANEQIDNLVVTWEEVLSMIERREIIDAKTIVGLLLWQSRRK